MSRTSRIDRHALQDTHPRHRLAERQRAPDEVCRYAAGLLESLAGNSSEARAAAEELRLLAKAIAKAEAVEQAVRRADAEALFRRQR